MIAMQKLGSGPAVVLVHGVPGSGTTWRRVGELLAVGHRVLVPDLVGFGATGGPPDVAQLRADAQADTLAVALDGLGVSGATVAGHDFGGPVALRLIDRRPDLVGAVALLATNAFADTAIPFPLSSVTWPLVGPAARACCSLLPPCGCSPAVWWELRGSGWTPTRMSATGPRRGPFA